MIKISVTQTWVAYWTLRGAVDFQQCHGRADLGDGGENHETLIHLIFMKKLFSEDMIGLTEVIICDESL